MTATSGDSAGTTPGLLFARMAPRPTDEQRFNEWYDDEHVPSRLGVPGFQAAHRYRQHESDPAPAYAALYELDEAAVLEGDAYRAMAERTAATTTAVLDSLQDRQRYVGRLFSVAGDAIADDPGPWLWAIGVSISAEHADDLDEWYEVEHVPMLLEADGWRRCRRYVLLDSSDSITHLALHDIAGPHVLESPDRQRAISTDWATKLRAQPWFQGHSVRWLFERIAYVN